jgi:hypothetical protein
MNNYLDYLTVYEYKHKKRLGICSDGGYVIGLLDEQNNNYDCYISAGVSNEESFSRDFINMFKMNKYNSYAFDGTIENYPWHYTNDITFIPKNINTFKDNNNTDLSFCITKFDNIFLKMDIEGCEYPWLLSLENSKLQQFKQIVIEFHGINDDSWNTTHSDKIECFKKLHQTHFVIHIHGNNCGDLTDNIPNTVEVTYLRKDLFDSEPKLNIEPLPIQNIDFSNSENKEDFDLNFKPFVN